MLVYVIAAVVLGAVLFLVIGAVTGRVKVRSCCAVDPSRDLRMRGVFNEQDRED